MEIFTLLGPFFAIVGLGVLLHFKRTMNMMQELMESKSTLFLMGCISLFLGLWILQTTQVVGREMWVLYIVGRGAVIKGTVMLLSPKMLKKTAMSMISGNQMFMQGRVFLMTLFGLRITRLAYMM